MKRALGNMEEALERTNSAGPFNIVVCLALGNAPCAEAVEGAFRRVCSRHPMLQVRLVQEKSGTVLTVEGVDVIPFEAIERQGPEHWQSIVEAFLNKQAGGERTPPVDVQYLFGSNGDAELVLAIRHSIMDGASVLVLLREVLEDCVSPSGMTEDPPLLLPPPIDDLLPDKFRSASSLLKFVGQQLIDEVRFRIASRGRKQPNVPPSGFTSFVELALGQEFSAALSRAARRNRVTVYATLCAAASVAANETLFSGTAGPVRLVSFHNLRPFLDPPVPDDQVGCYIAFGRSTIPLQENPNLWDVASLVNEKITKLGRSGDKFNTARLALRMTEPMVRYKLMRMGSAALTMNDASELAAEYGSINVRALHGMVSGQDIAPPFSIAATYFQGTWRLAMPYIASEFSRDEIQAYAERIKHLLENAAQ